MAPLVLLGYQRPGETSAILGRWHQVACAATGFLVTSLLFWLGYGALTGALDGLGLLAGTALIVLFFVIWGVTWAATEHVACSRNRQ